MEANEKWYKNLDKWDKIARIAASAITIIGMFVIFSQLRAANNQNIIEERSLRQQYRPLGEKIDLGYRKLKVIGSTNIEIEYTEYELKNKGAGVLLYIGTISCFSHNKIDLQSMLMKGEFDTTKVVIKTDEGDFIAYFQKKLYDSKKDTITTCIIFDKAYDNSRLQTVSQNDSTNIGIVYVYDKNLLLYFYSLSLYKDIDGNLYDTLTLDFYQLQQYFALNNSQSVRVHNEFYRSYSETEQRKLYQQIKKFNESMASAIAKDRTQLFLRDNKKPCRFLSPGVIGYMQLNKP